MHLALAVLSTERNCLSIWLTGIEYYTKVVLFQFV